MIDFFKNHVAALFLMIGLGLGAGAISAKNLFSLLVSGEVATSSEGTDHLDGELKSLSMSNLKRIERLETELFDRVVDIHADLGAIKSKLGIKNSH